MTDETPTDDTSTDEIVEGEETDGATAEIAERQSAELVARERTREELKRRVLVPLLVPILSVALFAVLAINISRVFLAGGKTGALIAVSVVTVGILAGAAYLSAKPRLRSSSLTLVTSAVVLLIVGAGLTTLGAAEEHGEEGGGSGYQEPEGEPTSTLSVAALATLAFNPETPSVAGGIVEINLTCDNCGSHTFLFDDSTYSDYKLEVPDGESASKKVELPEGEYVFYCDIPGHREAGMEGTLTVTAPAGGATTTSGPGGETTTTSAG